MHRQWNSAPQQQGGGVVAGGQQQQRYQQHRAPPFGAPAGGPKPLGNKCGLFGYNSYSQRRFSIPLKNVAIRAHVVDFFARVEVTQEYVNNDRNPVEVTYTFPIAARSAVCGFSAEVEGRKITGEVKENEEAANLYDDAISSGHGAFTGRSEKPNVFTAVVGNLPPGKQATIRITYVTELGLERSGGRGAAKEAPRLKFSLPSRLAPKYAKKNAQGTSSSSSFYPQRPEFKLTIEVDFALSSRIAGIAASQPVSIALPSDSHAKVTLGSMVNALKHDFTLLLQLEAPAATTGQQLATSYGLLEAPAADSPSGEYAAALVLYPKELFPAATTDKAATAAVDEEETEDEDETAATAEEEEKKDEAEPEKDKKPAAQKKEKPSITELRLDWGDLPAKEQIKNTAIPSSIFFSHGVLFLYSMLPNDAIPEGQEKIKVTLRGKLGDSEVSHDLFLDAKAAPKDSLVHQLYARSAIRALERGVEGKSDDEAKREIIDLSLAYSLSSRHTTFVAIEERQEATEGTMVRRTVPLNGLGYRQPIGGGARGGRGRGGFRGGAPRDSDRSFYGHDQRGGERGERPQYHSRDQRDGGGDSWSRGGAGAGAYGGGGGGGGRRGPAPAAAPPRKRLEITEELTDQLVALKGGDKDYWLLNSALAKLVDKNLTQIIDALVGVPIVDYISNVWATSLVITVLSHSGQKEKHAEVLKRAEAWLEEETKKYFLDSKDKWLAKAKAFLHL